MDLIAVERKEAESFQQMVGEKELHASSEEINLLSLFLPDVVLVVVEVAADSVDGKWPLFWVQELYSLYLSRKNLHTSKIGVDEAVCIFLVGRVGWADTHSA